MTRTIQRLAGCFAVLLIAAGARIEAEVSVTVRWPELISSGLLGITEGADPIDPIGWKQLRSGPPVGAEWVLNTSGFDRGDGRPDMVWDSSNGWPLVVWAWDGGPDYDVAFSQWVGEFWSPAEALAWGPSDELDPRIFVEPSGVLHVTWWTDDPVPAVYYSRRPAGTIFWTDPVRVSPPSDFARRPSVAVVDGVVRVAYERDSMQLGPRQEVVVARREPGGNFVPEVVARTDRFERLDVVLHAEAGRMWVDFKQSDGDFSYVAASGTAWNPPEVYPWTDPSWLGVESVRRAIRRIVLSQ